MADLAARIARARACAVFGTPESVVLALLDVAEAGDRMCLHAEELCIDKPQSACNVKWHALAAHIRAALDKLKEVL